MPAVHMSRSSIEDLVEERRRWGAGSLDECWEGVWHVTDPSGPHQRLAAMLWNIHWEVVGKAGKGEATISINVTDREHDWKQNHRCPDGAVILQGNPGRWIGAKRVAFLGGPDLVVEVLSEDDPTYQKLDFYRSLGVREVLVVDPDTSRPELWRLREGEYREVPPPAASEVTGLVYAQGAGCLEVREPSTGRSWKI
ncbi:MAG: Uma2 family endonuclease [Planctomycetes bacterium]|nr:Uma2 family endonuclease [Planctomycetota bacterium]